MAGVETHADAGGALQVSDERGQVFESIPERPPLTRRVLEQDERLASRPRLEGLPDGIGNQSQPALLGAGGAGAWMDHDAQQAERLRPIELVDECCE